jgi:uncharacterized membrane protein YfcA
MKEIIGYCCAALIGVLLGLIGGGGSILTIPVLVYLFGISPVLATSYSLCIVGVTSLVGAYNNLKKGYVDFNTVISFGIPSVITVLFIRKLVIPLIPAHLFYMGSLDVSFSLVIMVCFALLMVVASVAMITNQKVKSSDFHHRKVKFLFYGIGLGLVTGLLGAGGGFLIIPFLVLFVHMPMKKAVGTSLLIIATNAILGFLIDIAHYSIDWKFLSIIVAIAIGGVLTGGFMSKRLNGRKLRKGFGWFVLATGIFILVREIFFY